MTVNLKTIQDFFKSSGSEKLLFNQINDEINIFYIEVLNYFAKQNNNKIIKNKDVEDKTSLNLFISENIYIIETSNKKEIEKLINSEEKYIIFCNYKTFKIFNKNINFVNTYNFRHDLKSFIINILKIDCESLLYFLIECPFLISSEINKYYINGNDYSAPSIQLDQQNHILEIRKKINANKNDLYDLYKNIKKEASIKKLNFLTY